jgi:hypothetical protein
MQVILSETEHIRDLIRETYAEFEQDFGFQLTAPKVFAPMTFAVELELLYQELDAFRHSASLALAERRYVIRRFQTQMAGRALNLFDQLRTAFDTWGRDALQPIADRIKDDKTLMERRLDNLQRLGRSYQDTSRHLGEIQAQYAELARELAALDNINDALGNDSAPSGTIGAGLQVAAQRA